MSNGKELDQGLSAEAIVALTGVPSGFSLNRGSDLGDEANELDRETFARGGGDYQRSRANECREAARETIQDYVGTGRFGYPAETIGLVCRQQCRAGCCRGSLR